MSLPGYNSQGTRLATLVADARNLLSSTSPSALGSTGDSKDDEGRGVKEKLMSILDDAHAVASGLDDYVEQCSTLPDPKAQATKVIEEMLAATASTDWSKLYTTGQTKYKLMPEMSSNRYEAGLMSFLCSTLRPRRILEIGMFTGTITTVFAAAASVEKVISLEAEGYLESWCRPFWEKAGKGVSDKIEVMIGFASESLDKIAKDGEEAFDLILIDADKASYATYFKKIMAHKLLSKSGVLLVDNANYKAATYAPFTVPFLDFDSEEVKAVNDNGKALDVLNKLITDCEEVEVIMLPIRDGLSLVRWKGN